MQFHEVRRQQFLAEDGYRALDDALQAGIAALEENYLENTAYPASQMRLSASIARDMFAGLCLQFTAGLPIDPLRTQLESVLKAFERHAQHLWSVNDRNEPVFQFDVLDEYCQLMQLVGLCFLLHRRDLLPRIAAMQDGEGGKSNGGADTLFEEFMAYGLGPETRFETDTLCQIRPYENLFCGLTETTPQKGLKELELFLKHWYKDLAGTGWHDSHKPDEKGQQGGYHGYWSFEAGAAVLLLGIEDDSSLHKYLYYPKDMVAWAREHAALSHFDERAQARLRAMAGEPCPREGFWFTPAKADSHQRFEQGQVMPSVGGDYGSTIWQWDERQGS